MRFDDGLELVIGPAHFATFAFRAASSLRVRQRASTVTSIDDAQWSGSKPASLRSFSMEPRRKDS